MLRILLLLLFSFELLAPSVVYCYAAELPATDSGTIIFGAKTMSADVLSQILFEENSVEERIYRNYAKPIALFEVFNKLQKFEPVNITRMSPKEQFDSSPSLFTIHRVFLI